MEPVQYKIATLEDIAAIPEEALPRLLEDLPIALNFVRRGMAERKLLPEGTSLTLLPITWIDDGKQDVNITITVTTDQ